MYKDKDKEYSRRSYLKNKTKILERQKQKRLENPEKYRLKDKLKYKKNKEEIKKRNKKYYWLNRDDICRKWREGHKMNLEKDLEKRRKYVLKNKKQIDKKTKEWRKNNLEKVKEYKRRDRLNNKETYRKIYLRFKEKQKIRKKQRRDELLIKKISIGKARILERKKLKKQGRETSNWKGGKCIVDGYVYIYNPEHLFATKIGYVCEHRLVLEKHLLKNDKENENLIKVDGQLFLNPFSVVHHKDENIINNEINNLKACSTEEHNLIEHKREVDQFGMYRKRL